MANSKISRSFCRQSYGVRYIAITGAFALLGVSCRSSSSLTKESQTQLSSDSLIQRETLVSNFEPVPKRTVTLSLSADEVNNIATLPGGYGVSAKDGALSLRVESNGEGGVNITAESDSTARQVTVLKTETTHRIRDMTESTSDINTTKTSNNNWIWLCVGIIAVLTAIILLQRFFKIF